MDDGVPGTPALDTSSPAGWYVADFDGDGRDDYMFHDPGGWRVARSSGDRFESPTLRRENRS